MFEERDRMGSKIKFEPCNTPARDGDTVLVCAGLVNKGHMWILLEAEVLEVSTNAYLVRYTDYSAFGSSELFVEWISKGVVVDVISADKPFLDDAVEAAKFLWETYRHKDCFSGKAIIEKWPWLEE